MDVYQIAVRPHSSPRRQLPSVGAGIRGIRDYLKRVQIVSRQRRKLARLEDHLLSDIGKSRTEALAEAGKPVWDAPIHWKG